MRLWTFGTRDTCLEWAWGSTISWVYPISWYWCKFLDVIDSTKFLRTTEPLTIFLAPRRQDVLYEWGILRKVFPTGGRIEPVRRPNLLIWVVLFDLTSSESLLLLEEVLILGSASSSSSSQSTYEVGDDENEGQSPSHRSTFSLLNLFTQCAF